MGAVNPTFLLPGHMLVYYASMQNSMILKLVMYIMWSSAVDQSNQSTYFVQKKGHFSVFIQYVAFAPISEV